MGTFKAASLRGTMVIGAAALALTGCSSDAKKDASDAASKATSAVSSAASSATGASTSASSASATSTSPSGSSSAASSDASGSATGSSSGGQAVKATASKLGFEVPQGWVVVDESTAKNKDTLTRLEPIAKKGGIAPEKLVQNVLAVADVMAFNPEGKSASGESINVGKLTLPTLPTEALYRKQLSAVGAKPGKYERISTPAGPGAEESYSVSANGHTVHGMTVAILNGQGSYSAVAITTADAAQAAHYAEDVVASARKL